DGLSNEITKTIIVSNVPPVANFTWTPTNPNQKSDTVSFNSTTSYDLDGFIVNWSWTFGDGNTSYEQNPSHIYDDSGNYTATLTIEDNDGSHSTINKTIQVNNTLPTVDFNFTWTATYPFSHPTDMDIVNFTDNSSDPDGEIIAWHWEFSDPHPSDEQNPLHLFIDNSVYTVTLTVWDDGGASNSTSKNVTVVNIPPTADFTYTPHSFGIFEDVHFTDNSTDVDGVIVNWTWNFGDGNISYEQNPVYNYSKNGNFTITLNVTDDDGATDTATTQNITVLNNPLVADFTWNPTNPTDLETVNFTDTSKDSDGTVVNWTWNFGDGNHSYTQHPTHQYADNGTYQVTLTVRDNNDESNTTSKDITVLNVPPVADFTYTPTTPTNTDTIQFNDTSTDSDGTIVSWSWDFGDGNTSTNQNPSHQYGAIGNYTVTLTVTDNDGATDSSQKTVNVSASPVAKFIYCPIAYINVNEQIKFLDQSYDPDGYIMNWSWNFGDGNHSYEKDPIHAYTAANTYTVMLTVRDNSGATNSTSKDIIVTT
ncbi:PDK repeat-containing protein, partial [Thermoplasmatales archaeon SCGC AB-539-N05]